MSKILTFTKACIVGYGGIGRRVASLLHEQGVLLVAASRNPGSGGPGSENVSIDLDQPQSPGALEVNDAMVFYFAPPPPSGDKDTRMENFLLAIAGQIPAKIIYISTTGVYGDSKGEWISESSDTQPGTDRGKRRLDAEQQLTVFCKKQVVPLIIYRVPGIYGASRLPIDRIKQGRPVVKDLNSFTNRIHEDDLARICVKAAEPASPQGIYNVSDGQPGNMTQYFTDIANALGLPPLPEISWQEAQAVMSPEMLSYLAESRRIDNSKLLNTLNVKLLYPDFQSGLQACIRELKENSHSAD